MLLTQARGFPPEPAPKKLSMQATPLAEAHVKEPKQDEFKLSHLKERCFCGFNDSKLEMFKCSHTKCHNMAHRVCIPWKVTELGDFECTGCIVLTNDPLHEVKQPLLEPSLLVSGFVYKYKLSLDHLSLLKDNPIYGVEVRCIKMDGAHFFEQTWPDQCLIKVNDKALKEIKPLHQNSALKKRRDEKLLLPISNIKMGTNTISIDYLNVPDGKNSSCNTDPKYIFTVVLIEKVSIDKLSSKLRASCVLPEAEGKKGVKKRFLDNKDLKISEIKADLMCKISFTHMQVPVRGLHCTHLNCFSLEYYLKSMQSNNYRNWICPICRKPCYKLIIDSYMEKIVKTAQEKDPRYTQVIFKKDGSMVFSVDGDISPPMHGHGFAQKNSSVPLKEGDLEVLSIEEELGRNLNFRGDLREAIMTEATSLTNELDVDTERSQLLGKRKSDFLEDKEFMGHMHTYQSRRGYSSFPKGPGLTQISLSSFREKIKTRCHGDYFLRKMFNIFYAMIKQRVEDEKNKARVKGSEETYMELFSKISGVHEDRPDLLASLVREYRLEESQAYRKQQASPPDTLQSFIL
jgi:hypothetical protein